MTIKVVTTDQEQNEAYRIRKVVFVDEQNVPMDLEIDEHEEASIHFIAYDGKDVVGASRLRFVGEYGKLERICVLKSYRGKSYGKKLIDKMEEEIINKGYKKAKLHAQTHAKEFYERLGYVVISDEFMDAGIPHVAMTKELTK